MKFECDVYWVFNDGSRKLIAKVVVESFSEEYAKYGALRILDELSLYYPLAEPDNLSHYDAECREVE